MEEITKVKRPRRPRLTQERFDGLRVLAERVKPMADGRQSPLFRLPKSELAVAKLAIKYVEEMDAWRRKCRAMKPLER